MPTYAYRCSVCGHSFDVYQAFSDASLTECPECTGLLRKVFSVPAVSFKGSGFYLNDSKGSSSSSAPAKSAKTAATPASSATPAPSSPAPTTPAPTTSKK